ncbi:VapA/VapB family virulence-associated protein [Sphingomonas sp. OTU376]|uniref:VapA/VapB family virulence-associated protein n=1 Tax=Sphingomonas sp. OTU376 TaxID=3043863 RepID=UPI00313C596F
MTTDTQTVEPGRQAADLQQLFDGKVPQQVLDSARAHLESRPLVAASSGDATLIITGGITGQLHCVVDDGPTFLGHFWGGAPATRSPGSIYTDDPERLYSQSTSFMLVATPVYVSLIFLDDSGNALGSFQGRAIGTVSGSYGGTGSWS